MADARTTSHSPAPGFVHEALMYRDEAEFEAAVHAFLREAAAAGEPVLVALPGRHLAHVREALADEMPDVRLEDVERWHATRAACCR